VPSFGSVFVRFFTNPLEIPFPAGDQAGILSGILRKLLSPDWMGALQVNRVKRWAWILCSLGLLAAQGQLGPSGDWKQIADGITYQIFNLAGPNHAYVVRMDRSNPNLTLDTSLADGRLTEGKQTVSQMAERYDGTLGSWEPAWGGRNKVVAAINGSFHDEESGKPLSGMVQSGWYIKRFDDLGGGSGFAWRLDRSAFIGGCVSHPDSGQLVTYLNTGVQQTIGGIDDRRKGNELVVYTSQFDARTQTSDNGAEVVVELDQPFMILTYPQMIRGVVRAIHTGNGDSPIPFDSVVLSATGSAAQKLLDNVEIGSLVGLSTEIQHFKADCRTPDNQSWEETYASLSGSFPFLLDGDIQSFKDTGAATPSPRTAVCFNDKTIDFVVVDGRNEGVSIGMTINELARFCRDRLNDDWGINQDGGGSSTLWLDGQVVNQPSDGHERAVANGLMMVEVQPPKFSETYRTGDTVQTTQLLDFRLGPGENYRGASDLPEGTRVAITRNANGLDGVRATGDYWWQVSYKGDLGWVPESALELVKAAPPTPTGDGQTQVSPPADSLDSLLASPDWLRDKSWLPPLPWLP
jgi:hypothetical protein